MRSLKNAYFCDPHASKVDAAIIKELEQMNGAISRIREKVNEISQSVDPAVINRINERISFVERSVRSIETQYNNVIARVELDEMAIDDIADAIEDIYNAGYQTAAQVETAINGKGYQTAAQVETAINGKGYQTAAQVETAINGKGYQTAAQVETAISNKGYDTDIETILSALAFIESEIANINARGYQTAAQVDAAIAASKPKYCKGVRNSNATTATAGTITDLPIEALEINNSGFAIIGGAVKVPNEGIVRIHASIHYAASTQTVAQGCYIKRNGTEILGNFNFGAGVVDAECYETVNAGDLISFATRASVASRGVDYKNGSGYKNTYLFIEYL